MLDKNLKFDQHIAYICGRFINHLVFYIEFIMRSKKLLSNLYYSLIHAVLSTYMECYIRYPPGSTAKITERSYQDIKRCLIFFKASAGPWGFRICAHRTQHLHFFDRFLSSPPIAFEQHHNPFLCRPTLAPKKCRYNLYLLGKINNKVKWRQRFKF